MHLKADTFCIETRNMYIVLLHQHNLLICLLLQVQGVDMAVRVRKLPEGMESFNDYNQNELAEEESDEEDTSEEEQEEEEDMEVIVSETCTVYVL